MTGRTFRKNKVLFPVFSITGAPKWCMVMSMTCPCCHRRCAANDGKTLVRIPACAAASYPVRSKCALPNKHCHLSKDATQILDLLMPTYGNGDLCSRLLCNAINRDYLERVQQCYSYASNGAGTCRRLPYIEKDGEFIRAFPPLGDAIRDVYDEACSSSNTPWKVSDHDRHTREIAGWVVSDCVLRITLTRLPRTTTDAGRLVHMHCGTSPLKLERLLHVCWCHRPRRRICHMQRSSYRGGVASIQRQCTATDGQPK